ncbi:hypothetical protein DXG03_007423, partial [Asterophora parasitica]
MIDHRLLLNTSGAGKTRLMLEGLCDEWGLYFTCRSGVDNIGSSDIQSITGFKSDLAEKYGYLQECGGFSREIPLDHSDRALLLTRNAQCTNRFFQAAITARILSFLLFLDAAQDHKEVPTQVKKKIWTLVQTNSQLLSWDDQPFSDLFSQLTAVLCHGDPEILRGATVEILNSCLEHIKANSLRCVIDEAQTAAETLPKAFHSTGEKPKHRPVLRALLAKWMSFQLGFVITGTSLNRDIVADALSSTVGKQPGIQTGITDVGKLFGPSDVRLYLEKYLDPEDIQNIARGELVRRACYWLTGRPRFTASYIEYLLHHGLKNPHRVLTKYIDHLTKFTPNDGEAWERMEVTKLTWEVGYPPRPFDFERIQ